MKNNSQLTEKRKRKLEELQKKLNLEFKNLSLLDTALTHSSYAHEVYLNENHNEKLEFLGDAVLSLVITEYIYKNYNSYPEGLLAKIKSYIVSEPVLFKISKKLSIGKYLLLGKSEKKSEEKEKTSILADVLEALIGALYIDKGIEKTKKFILNLFVPFIEDLKNNLDEIKDYKSRFQELTQKLFKTVPEYFVISEQGPDHCKVFEVGVKVGDKIYGKGIGFNKKEAEREAAKKALKNLEEEKLYLSENSE